MSSDFNANFEPARFFDQISFGEMGDFVGSFRFMPTGGHPEDTIHTSQKVTALFEPWETGELLLDLRPQDYCDYPIASIKFVLADGKLSLANSEYSLSYLDKGLLSYLVATAQRITDWRYHLVGVEMLSHW